MGCRAFARSAMTAALLAMSVIAAKADCEETKYEGNTYAVCRFDNREIDLRLFWQDAEGNTFQSYRKLRANLDKKGEKLAFAMNAGMYHPDFKPVGLFIENGVEKTKLNTRRGPGNFHMLPNGVFYIGPNGANVLETGQFVRLQPRAMYATQSGPMLVIDGKLHPKFNESGDSRKLRNGVGICGANQLVFAISSGIVTFYEFGTLFRDHLKCRNALFLDGTVSSIYAPEIKRTDNFWPMGPIVGIVEKKPREK